jgi:succinate dehydrogenase/fumarate reductase cytochrome b subunit
MGIVEFIQNILYFINAYVVPFILALAFLIFVFNAARYFIIQGAQEEARTKAKSLALWGVLAFVFILSIWGIVNMLVLGLGFNRSQHIVPDYMCDGFGGTCQFNALDF